MFYSTKTQFFIFNTIIMSCIIFIDSGIYYEYSKNDL